MTTTAELYALQEIDLSLDKAKARLGEILQLLGESEELIAARLDVEEKQRAADALRSRQGDLEFDVQEVRTKAQDVDKKLYGGAVRNPKELSDLQDDLTSLLAQLRKREDALLGVLVELEDHDEQLKQARSAYSEVDERWRWEQKELEAERERLEAEVRELSERQEKQSVGIDRAILGLYSLLRERRAGKAMARVERGMCQGCRITLPMSVLQRARTGQALVQCVSCERILVVG